MPINFLSITLGLMLMTSLPAPASGQSLPLKEKAHNGAAYRWHHKPIHRRVVLADMEQGQSPCVPASLAKLSYTTEKSHGGEYSICMTLPIRGSKEGNFRSGNTNYGFGGVEIPANGADWSEFTRLSCWVYPVAPGLDELGIDV